MTHYQKLWSKRACHRLLVSKALEQFYLESVYENVCSPLINPPIALTVSFTAPNIALAALISTETTSYNSGIDQETQWSGWAMQIADFNLPCWMCGEDKLMINGRL